MLTVFSVRFSDFPLSVRRANLFLVASWTFHCFFVYFLFRGQTEQFPTKILMQQIVIGAVLCVFFLLVKRWARILSILFNLAAVVMYILVAVLFYGARPSVMAFSLFNMCLFSVSIYYLLMKETSCFFKPQPETGKRGNGVTPACTQ